MNSISLRDERIRINTEIRIRVSNQIWPWRGLLLLENVTGYDFLNHSVYIMCTGHYWNPIPSDDPRGAKSAMAASADTAASYAI